MKEEKKVEPKKAVDTFAFDDLFRAAEVLVQQEGFMTVTNDIHRAENAYCATAVVHVGPGESISREQISTLMDFATKWGAEFRLEPDSFFDPEFEGGSEIPFITAHFSVFARKLE